MMTKRSLPRPCMYNPAPQLMHHNTIDSTSFHVTHTFPSHHRYRPKMEYWNSVLGVKQGKGHVSGSMASSIPPAAAPTARTFDVTFGPADTQLGMTITFDKMGQPVVESVVAGGAANQKGVKEGDWVISVDGNPVGNYESLEVALCAMERPVVFSFRCPADSMCVADRMTSPSSRHRSNVSDADEQRRRAMLAAAEERSKAYERKMGKGGIGNTRGSKKSGEGLDKFAAKDDEWTRAHVEQIKRFEAEQAAALGYNPYESQSMSRGRSKRLDESAGFFFGGFIRLHVTVIPHENPYLHPHTPSPRTAQAQARIELSAPVPSTGSARPSMVPTLPPSSSLPRGDPSPSSSSMTSSSPEVGSGIPQLSQEEYESPEAFKANEEADMAMARMLDQPPESWRVAVSTILRILVNVLEDPFQEKYRRVRLQNPTFVAKVSAVTGSLDLLHAAGFGYKLEGEETFLALPLPAPEVPLQTRVLYHRLKQILNDAEDSRLGMVSA